MSQVVYYCATGAQPSTGLNTFCYFYSHSFVARFEPLVVVLSQVVYHCARRAQQCSGQFVAIFFLSVQVAGCEPLSSG
jgi:hypothetical protein